MDGWFGGFGFMDSEVFSRRVYREFSNTCNSTFDRARFAGEGWLLGRHAGSLHVWFKVENRPLAKRGDYTQNTADQMMRYALAEADDVGKPMTHKPNWMAAVATGSLNPFDFGAPTLQDLAVNISELSARQLRRAASLKERIENLQKELTSILGTATPAPTAHTGRKQKRTMSAAAKKHLSEFHKARWAKIKGPAASPTAKPKKKFTMSASAKAAISKAAKARWAKIKAAQKQ